MDPFGVTGALLAGTMTLVYVWLMRQQQSEPKLWVLGILLAGAALAGYGAVGGAKHRRAALLVATALLIGLGLVGLLTIGLPLILAGVLCLTAVARTRAAG